MTSPVLHPFTVDDLLGEARRWGLQRLDARILVAHALQRTPTWVLAHGDDTVDATAATQALALLQRRADGVPVAYLVGQREFHGLMLQVDPRVLDPRADTEVLADWAIEQITRALDPTTPASGSDPAPQALRVADLGTGSGALALAIANAFRRATQSQRLRVWATDQSADALAVAEANAQRLGLAVQFAKGHWLDALPAGLDGFHLLLSNPPYLADNDPHLPDLRHEPRTALVAEDGGWADLQHLVDRAPTRLAANGWLLLEHGHDQGERVALALRRRGYVDIEHRQDLAGLVRCTGGRWP